ncbi:Uncharacterized protein APZ42_024272 [Daphnia magna]|uniref:Uncharacterized protein n=1 Tax=Daphnia magna TaxID=35525 RepID=A0A164UKQ5_9CRUS|nr:Uncharacterized protein APZ42_024272 [Daphnia magna]
MSSTTREEPKESLSTFIVIYCRSPGSCEDHVIEIRRAARHMCERLLCTTVTHKLCEDQHFYGQLEHVDWSQQSRDH